MAFICDFCGKEEKRTWQHIFAGDLENSEKGKMCESCHHHELNPIIENGFNALKSNSIIDPLVVVGNKELSCSIGSSVVDSTPMELPSVPGDYRHILELQIRARDFKGKDYPFNFCQSGTAAFLTGGSVGGIFDHVVVYDQNTLIWKSNDRKGSLPF